MVERHTRMERWWFCFLPQLCSVYCVQMESKSPSKARPITEKIPCECCQLLFPRQELRSTECQAWELDLSDCYTGHYRCPTCIGEKKFPMDWVAITGCTDGHYVCSDNCEDMVHCLSCQRCLLCHSFQCDIHDNKARVNIHVQKYCDRCHDGRFHTCHRCRKGVDLDMRQCQRCEIVLCETCEIGRKGTYQHCSACVELFEAHHCDQCNSQRSPFPCFVCAQPSCTFEGRCDYPGCTRPLVSIFVVAMHHIIR